MRFFDGLHVRHEKILSAGIEDAFDENEIVPRWTHHGCSRAARGGALQLRDDAGQFIWRVLHVNEDPVKARTSDDFRAEVAAQAAPQADLRPSFAHCLLE